jgi:hypothetical protein
VTVVVCHLFHQRYYFMPGTHITMYKSRFQLSGLQSLQGLLSGFRIGIGYDHSGTFSGKCLRHAQAYTLPSAGQQHIFIFVIGNSHRFKV